MVSQNGDIRDVQFVENVALSFEFGAHAEIGEVARVDDEIEPVAVVECFDRLFRFVIPLLRIGNDSETNRLFTFRCGFYPGDILLVDIPLAMHAGIVRMVFHPYRR